MNKVEGLTLSNFKTYYESTVVTTLSYWWKKSKTDHLTEYESSEIDPHEYNQLTFDKRTKEQRQYNVAKTVFSTKSAKATGQMHEKKILIKPYILYITLYIKTFIYNLIYILTFYIKPYIFHKKLTQKWITD